MASGNVFQRNGKRQDPEEAVALRAEVKALLERVEKLEEENAELLKKLTAARAVTVV